jgi:hypothetical protein
LNSKPAGTAHALIGLAIAQGFQKAGDQIANSQTDPFILYNMNSHPSALYQSWHNSDGSSGHYVPNPGGVRGGAFFNGNGEIDQYVPYPGGNGGTIFHANGTITNIDPQIGGY